MQKYAQENIVDLWKKNISTFVEQFLTWYADNIKTWTDTVNLLKKTVQTPTPKKEEQKKPEVDKKTEDITNKQVEQLIGEKPTTTTTTTMPQAGATTTSTGSVKKRLSRRAEDGAAAPKSQEELAKDLDKAESEMAGEDPKKGLIKDLQDFFEDYLKRVNVLIETMKKIGASDFKVATAKINNRFNKYQEKALKDTLDLVKITSNLLPSNDKSVEILNNIYAELSKSSQEALDLDAIETNIARIEENRKGVVNLVGQMAEFVNTLTRRYQSEAGSNALTIITKRIDAYRDAFKKFYTGLDVEKVRQVIADLKKK